MRKLSVMEEPEAFHRVWNFVVPLHKIGDEWSYSVNSSSNQKLF